MTYFDFIDRTDSLLRALSTCALTRQAAKFDCFIKKLDQLYAEYPEHYKKMLADRYIGCSETNKVA
jgi:hypothetical protein